MAFTSPKDHLFKSDIMGGKNCFAQVVFRRRYGDWQQLYLFQH